MKLNKTLGVCLYRLFGENGSDALVHRSQKREIDCYRELERHGLVKLVQRTGQQQQGLFDVVRLERSLKPAPLRIGCDLSNGGGQ